MKMTLLRAWWPALIGTFLFVGAAMFLIPYAGLQEDELIFGPSIFNPGIDDHMTLGRLIVPRMLLSYLGATKTWLFFVIFKFWKPSLYSTRVPVILLYALTIWVFFAVLQTIHSRRAAIVGTLLLATDPVYVLTGSFGWCNLQNILMIASMGAFLKFYKDANRLWLAVAAFCTGLWLWDKAVGMWMLSGLVLAVAILFPREAWSRINWANIAIGLAAFCLGAFPLILFNVKNHYPTLHSNAHFSTVGFSSKVAVLKATAGGSAWLGSVVSEPTAAESRVPQTGIEKWSMALHDYAGEHRSDDLPYAFGASLLFLPVLLAWRRYPAVRVLLFSLIVMSIAWLQMAVTEGAGSGGHHPALMWPFPQLLIAVAFAEVSLKWRAAGAWLLAAAVVLLMASNLLTLNQYLYQFTRFGGGKGWSDAIYALSDQMPGYRAEQIYISDWGIINPLATLSRGRLPLRWEADAVATDHPPTTAVHDALEAFAAKNSIWVVHTADNEMFAGVNARLDEMISAYGYQKIKLGQVRDRHQTPIFEIFRTVPGPVPVERNPIAAKAANE